MRKSIALQVSFAGQEVVAQLIEPTLQLSFKLSLNSLVSWVPPKIMQLVRIELVVIEQPRSAGVPHVGIAQRPQATIGQHPLHLQHPVAYGEGE